MLSLDLPNGRGSLADKVRPSTTRPGETEVAPEDSEVPASVAGVEGDGVGSVPVPGLLMGLRSPAVERAESRYE